MQRVSRLARELVLGGRCDRSSSRLMCDVPHFDALILTFIFTFYFFISYHSLCVSVSACNVFL